MADTMRKNTDATVRGGAVHSSDQTSVTEAERRDSVIPADSAGQPGNGEEPMISAKPFSIAKAVVWKAYQRVKANRGAAGIDNESIEMFERNLGSNLYKLWNRMSSGSTIHRQSSK